MPYIHVSCSVTLQSVLVQAECISILLTLGSTMRPAFANVLRAEVVVCQALSHRHVPTRLLCFCHHHENTMSYLLGQAKDERSGAQLSSPTNS